MEKKMSSFICPVCKSEMITNNNVITCKNNHNFDKAKQGYINLLLSQQDKEKVHGDDKIMVKSRSSFLNAGYFDILLSKIISIMNLYLKNENVILDAGCGECFYTSKICDNIFKNKTNFKMLAVDISKNAVVAGAKRNKNIELAVASLYNLPIKDNFCDIMLSIFAPFCNDEFKRVLKKDGIIIKVIPLEKHLWSLKKAIYENPYENTLNLNLEGFELVEKTEIKTNIHISSHNDIINMFSMTPYYYKTGKEDREKLINLNEIDTEIEFGIIIYNKLI
jgi:23S rRNA (guanine745-N1)-methyltransferase